jgi:hypothetical protein
LPQTLDNLICDDNPLYYDFDFSLENINHHVVKNRPPVLK